MPSLGSVVVPAVGSIVVPALASSPVVVGLVLVVGVSPVVLPAVVVPALMSVAAVGSVVGMVVTLVPLPSSPQATRPSARVSMVVREVSARIFR